MAKNLYIGVEGKARKAKKIYVGIGGTAREVKKAYIGVNGVARLFYSGGKRLSDLPVGTIVNFRENGTYVPYEIINQGAPSHQGEKFSCYYGGTTLEVTTSVYDSSCNGTWILRYQRSTTWPYNTSGSTNWGTGSEHSYCMNTFYPMITDKHLVKQVVLPSPTGQSTVGVITTSCFLLSAFECGQLFHKDSGDLVPLSKYPQCGAPLQWVNPYWDHAYGENPNSSIIAGHDPNAEKWLNTWMLRSTIKGRDSAVYGVNGGSQGIIGDSQSNRTIGIRPTMVLNADALVDENNNILP